MKLTWLTLPILLVAGMASALGLKAPAQWESISPKSDLVAILDSYQGRADTIVYLAAGVRNVCETSILSAPRSMWGQ
jgi:hypothetical protein